MIVVYALALEVIVPNIVWFVEAIIVKKRYSPGSYLGVCGCSTCACGNPWQVSPTPKPPSAQ